MRNTRFEPYGPTGNPQVPWATSVIDYIFHWLQMRFGTEPPAHVVATGPSPADASSGDSGIGCPDCGALLAYQEGCLVCRSCGYNRCG
ncbi:MAG: hypothetical protein E6I02_09785 [Chloroflexi bacterium]|nr:MAG: hypothetical protein E6I02_09785 [Chloroflexota bacterium]